VPLSFSAAHNKHHSSINYIKGVTNMESIVFKADKFNVRVVSRGDKYGLNFALTHNGIMPLVEFYDSRYPHTEFGQFVSRYYLDTIVNRDDRFALSLDGGVTAWTVPAEVMAEVIRTLEKLVFVSA
jgi:hypothetical protein